MSVTLSVSITYDLFCTLLCPPNLISLNQVQRNTKPNQGRTEALAVMMQMREKRGWAAPNSSWSTLNGAHDTPSRSHTITLAHT